MQKPTKTGRLLCVTGSRTIDGSHAPSHGYALQWLHEEGRDFAPTLFMCGGADGFDVCAREWCKRTFPDVPRITFRADGARLKNEEPDNPPTWRGDWYAIRDARGEERPAWQGTPLERNCAEVAAAFRSLVTGWEVLWLGAVDRASKTHGTEQTLSLAQSFGLKVRRVVIHSLAQGLLKPQGLSDPASAYPTQAQASPTA